MMASQYVVLVRHGEYCQQPDAPSALQPHPLTPRGEEQARQTGKLLLQWMQEEGWQLTPVMACSPLQRAWQTAALIAQEFEQAGHTIDIQQSAALCERSVGALANLTVSQIESVLAADPRFGPLPAGWKSRADFRLPVPGAESLRDAGSRVAVHLGQQALRIAQDGPEQLLVVVGHGAAFRHAAEQLGVLKPEQVAALSMFHAGAVCLRYEPRTMVWSHHRGQWKQRALGETPQD